MKHTYSKGSNDMRSDYDKLEVKEKPKKLQLIIANCRGKKPVIRELDKARKIISNLMVEINPCEGKTQLRHIDNVLFNIIEENS